jgi:hypothetical protein
MLFPRVARNKVFPPAAPRARSRALVDGFDVVTVRVQDERSVVTLAVGSIAGSAVVRSPGIDSRLMKGIDLIARARGEGDMGRGRWARPAVRAPGATGTSPRRRVSPGGRCTPRVRSRCPRGRSKAVRPLVATARAAANSKPSVSPFSERRTKPTAGQGVPVRRVSTAGLGARGRASSRWIRRRAGRTTVPWASLGCRRPEQSGTRCRAGNPVGLPLLRLRVSGHHEWCVRPARTA